MRAISEDERARYCEAMLYDYEPEWRPDGLIELDRPDVLAWKRGWRLGQNRVAYAKWSETEAERRIDELLGFFGDAPFNWNVGPSSTPADLTARLVRRGLVLDPRRRMMTVALPLSVDRLAPGDVRIVEVRDAATARLGLELAHHESGELESDLKERLQYLELATRRGGFLLAYIGETPVANASYRYSADGRCVYLTGAETVEAFRGRGVYKALVAYRAARAVERGCTLAAILANRETSAPILARRGFADHGELPRLTPPGSPRFGLRAIP
jgi:GNAT superfamily N-acetyltransferase